MILLAAYFAIGFIQDVLGIVDFKATQHNRAALASTVGFIAEYAGWIVFYFILTAPGVIKGENWEKAALEIGVYCLGGAIGNYVAMKFIKTRRKDDSKI